MSKVNGSVSNTRMPLALTLALCGCWFIIGLSIGYSRGDSRIQLTVEPNLPPGAESPQSASQKEVAAKYPAPKTKHLCLDTCPQAKNGKCEDGSSAAADITPDSTDVLCDVGTDCSDCGPWKGSPGLQHWNGTHGPVALLRRHGVAVKLRRTTRLQRNFLMPYTDPEKDSDVSSQMHHNGIVEGGISWIFQTALQGKCQQGPGLPPLVVDVGANFGWYTLLSASQGCRVRAWEPVPLFRAFLEYGVQLNNLTHLVDIRATVLSSQAGLQLQMVVPNRGIWGTAGIDGLNIDLSITNDGPPQQLLVRSDTLNEAVKEDVVLIKVDVEGFEPQVMAGARRLLSRHRVENIVMEYSPGVMERHMKWKEMEQCPRMLTHLLGLGYKMVKVNDAFCRTMEPWASRLPALPEITKPMLAHDIADAQKVQNRTLGCSKPPQLAHSSFQVCNAIPEDLHPKSFHSTFGHNTNIWATRNPSIQQRGPPPSALPMDAPPTQYFVPEGKALGMGDRSCKHILPAMQVRHRCRCTNASVCGALERQVEKLALEGKLTY